MDEARFILDSEPEHASALNYIGWWLLTHEPTNDSTRESISILERSLKSSKQSHNQQVFLLPVLLMILRQ